MTAAQAALVAPELSSPTLEPVRQLGQADRQPSSRLALALEAPRDSVIMTTPCSPTNSRASQAGTRRGGLAPIAAARAGSHSAIAAGSSSTTL